MLKKKLRLLRLAWVPIFILVGISAYRARGFEISTSDFDDFHQTVRMGLYESDRPTMSAEWGVFNYHPFFMVVMAPLGALPMPIACAAFLLMSIYALMKTARAALDRWLPDATIDIKWAVGLGATFLVAPYLVNSILLGQFECAILAALCGAYALLDGRRDFAAGLLIAAAALLKAFPGLLLPWLLLKRKWTAVAGVVAGLVLGSLVFPTMLFGWTENARLHEAWWTRAVVGNSALNELVQSEGVMWRYPIEALPILLRRYLTPQPYDLAPTGPTIQIASIPTEPVWIAGCAFAPIQLVYIAIVAAILIAACAALRQPARRLSSRQFAREFAFVVLLSVLLSPIIWAGRYFLLAFPAVVWLVHAVFVERAGGVCRRFSTITLGVWSISLVCWTDFLRACGVHFWAAALLAGWCVIAAGCEPASRSVDQGIIGDEMKDSPDSSGPHAC